MTGVWSSLIGVFGALAGFLIAGWNQRAADRRAFEREAEARRSERLDRLEDERHDLQLATLVELQESLRLVIRSAVLWIDRDRREIEASGSWSYAPAAEDAESFAQSVKFIQLAARITDNDLREQLDSVHELCGSFSMPPMDWQSISSVDALNLLDMRFSQLIDTGDSAAKHLAAVLRQEIDRREQLKA